MGGWRDTHSYIITYQNIIIFFSLSPLRFGKYFRDPHLQVIGIQEYFSYLPLKNNEQSGQDQQNTSISHLAYEEMVGSHSLPTPSVNLYLTGK